MQDERVVFDFRKGIGYIKISILWFRVYINVC